MIGLPGVRGELRRKWRETKWCVEEMEGHEVQRDGVFATNENIYPSIFATRWCKL